MIRNWENQSLFNPKPPHIVISPIKLQKNQKQLPFYIKHYNTHDTQNQYTKQKPNTQP